MSDRNKKLVFDSKDYTKLAQELRATAAILNAIDDQPDNVEELMTTIFEVFDFQINPRFECSDGSYINLITRQSYEEGMTVFDINPMFIREKESDDEKS